jgi:Undecaprenyl-phosphate glucose phosphotransferase
MTLRFKAYRFYFRLWFYLLPVVAFALAAYVRFFDLYFHAKPVGYDAQFYVIICGVTTIIWCVAAEHNRLFHIDELFQENTGIRKTLAAVSSTYLTVVCVLFFYRQENISRIFFAISAVLLSILTVSSRTWFRVFFRGRYMKKPIRVLIVGADRHAAKIAKRLTGIPFAPSVVAAHLRLPGQEVAPGIANVYQLEAVDSWLSAPFDEILIALPPVLMDSVSELIKQLEPLHVPIRTVLDFGDMPIVRERLFQLGDLQFLDLKTTPLESEAYFVLKRGFDVCFSLVIMVLGLPLFLVIALAVKLSSPGPVLFKQERVGLNGRAFTMYKFRTMRVGPVELSDRSHTKQDDPRRTRVGTWLRRTSLDEIPQFVNVLKGDMSIVGPRPELTFFAQKYSQELSNYATRHRLKVGITGWARVNGWRGNTSIERRIDADLYYLQNWTFWLDLRIVVMTVFKGMVADHAY